jgi:adenylosuccinate synthase
MLDIVVGGQIGDEGKAKALDYLAVDGDYSGIVRVGGSQAGHSIYIRGEKLGLKAVPCGVNNPDMLLYIAAGSYIRKDYLLDELEKTQCHNRFKIDYRTVIITDNQIEEENADSHLVNKVGSVKSGVGKAVRDRVERKDILFAKDVPELEPYLADVSLLVNKDIEKGRHYLGEMTQGASLDNVHGDYPYVTSRCTIAGMFLAELGSGPKTVRDVYICFKPYVTRSSTGPILNEIKDQNILEKMHTKGGEVGTVSKRLRRIGEFEWDNAKKAVMLNSATELVLTHIDMFEGNEGKKTLSEMTEEAVEFIKRFDSELGTVYPYPVMSLISYGPRTEETIDLRCKK